GAVDLTRVRVVHLSGIVEGRDGLWHDGHTQPVHDVVWQLLEFLLPCISSPVTVVLEHSDYVWTTREDAFRADVAKTQAILEVATPASATARPIDAIALGYL